MNTYTQLHASNIANGSFTNKTRTLALLDYFESQGGYTTFNKIKTGSAPQNHDSRHSSSSSKEEFLNKHMRKMLVNWITMIKSSNITVDWLDSLELGNYGGAQMHTHLINPIVIL